MLKRLVVATAVAASTLVISGPITVQPANAATDANCTAVEQRAVPAPAAKPCYWKTKYGMWCKYCYKFGKYRFEHCKSRPR
ncbi:hypothetical protein ACTWPT_49730 [Nonomuraea sp. 3N208]|uniref:hypothetical protein n=1 Tax=Nonomuraea sp. 3N208 TaxID=3457421 RepID=UPI003FD5213D